MSSLLLGLDLQARIAAAAVEAFPRECCGLLEGNRLGDEVVVDRVWPARNLCPEADGFEIDPADHFRALRGARERGARIVGCYHSHPNGVAELSPRDRASAVEEGFLWIVAALADAGTAPVIGAFEFRGGDFRPLPIQGAPTLAPAGPATL